MRNKIKERCPFYITLILLSIWLLVNVFIGERVPIAEGEGWDGQVYADMAYRFGAYLHNLSTYNSGRVFPSLMVHMIGKIVSYPLILPAHIIRLFYLYDLVVILIATYFFYRIAKIKEWPFPVFLIGFSCVFINYPILKMMPYYPILTDYTALTLIIILLYFYISNSFWGMLIIAFLGAFTFPTILSSACILIFFYKHASLNIVKISLRHYVKPVWIAILMTIMGIGVMIYSVKAVFTASFNVDTFLIFSHSALINLLSLCVLFIYLTLIFYFFAKRYEFIFFVNLISLVSIIMLVIAIHVIKEEYLIGNEVLNSFNFMKFIINISISAVTNPGVFLVSHFIYYGPAVLLMLIYWRKMVDTSYKHGLDWFLLLLCFSVFSVGSESRQLIAGLPIVVFLLCETLSTENISLKFSYSIFFISLLISKIWLPLNLQPWPPIPSTLDAMLHFPYQMYFMTQGPWMSNLMYVVQLSAMLIIFLGLLIWKYYNTDVKLFYGNDIK